MKKLLIHASVTGIVVGIIYWLCTKGKENAVIPKDVDKKLDLGNSTQYEEKNQGDNTIEEMYQAKSDRVQAMYERHYEAKSIMLDAYGNIMDDFVEDVSIAAVNGTEENKEIIIDSESVSVIKEIDSISDELDDLLK